MLRHVAGALAASLFSLSALAQVTVTDPWVRATVPAQKSTGAFMQVQSAQAARLVAVTTPVAGRAELHEMSMQGEVMRMRQVQAIELPAGKAVSLAPGGYHVMLFDLKRQLKEGEHLALTLEVEAGGRRERVEVSAPVTALGKRPGAPAAGSPAAGHQGHDGHAGHSHH